MTARSRFENMFRRVIQATCNCTSIYTYFLHRFSIECRKFKTKTKIITLANQNRGRRSNEQIGTRSKYMSPAISVGKRDQVAIDFGFTSDRLIVSYTATFPHVVELSGCPPVLKPESGIRVRAIVFGAVSNDTNSYSGTPIAATHSVKPVLVTCQL